MTRRLFAGEFHLCTCPRKSYTFCLMLQNCFSQRVNPILQRVPHYLQNSWVYSSSSSSSSYYYYCYLWRETTFLNCCHERRHCSSPRWYEFGERRRSDIDRVKPKNSEKKTCPIATLCATNRTNAYVRQIVSENRSDWPIFQCAPM
jgi:hypothetical protein